MTKVVVALLAFLLLSCESTAPKLTFESAHKFAQAQPQDAAYGYEDKWDTFNNANKLDEKGDCYKKTEGPIEQVLILDKDGVVSEVIANVNNAKSNCFRASYLHVKFPAPPFSPYYMRLKMD
ncbi:MAG: hypothetical protein RL020_2035 [Pseudomonadota bacterium]|jgi:hypothetical protein